MYFDNKLCIYVVHTSYDLERKNSSQKKRGTWYRGEAYKYKQSICMQIMVVASQYTFLYSRRRSRCLLTPALSAVELSNTCPDCQTYRYTLSLMTNNVNSIVVCRGHEYVTVLRNVNSSLQGSV